MLVIDEAFRVVAVNNALARLSGGDPTSVIGSPMWAVLRGANGDQADAGADVARMLPTRARRGEADPRGSVVESLWIGPLGDRQRMEWAFTPMAGPFDGHLIGVGVDITEQRKSEALWRQRAQTDPLTRLSNRLALREGLSDHLDPTRGLGCGLLFCDLDGFKQLNDTHGHAAGDQLLIQVGQRLVAGVRDGDLVARVGGDEFVVLLPAAGAIETRAAATRLERAVTRPHRLSVGLVRVGISVGYRVADVGEDPEQVLGEADAAMYVVKTRRRLTRTASRSVA